MQGKTEKRIKMTDTINIESETAFNTNTILTLLLKYLDNNQIIYALLESTDYNTDWEKDIKLLVSGKIFKKISGHIYEFCEQNDLIPVQKLRYETTACFFVLSYFNNQQDRFVHIKVDVCCEYKIDGCFYLSSKELLHNRSYVIEKNYWRLNDTYSFLYYLIKSIDKKNFSQTQFSQLSKYWVAVNAGIVQKLKRFFSEDSITIISKCFNGKDLNYLNSNLEDLNKDLQAKVPKLIRDIISDKLRLLSGALKPSGLVVGILGRDGSGKSTFVNEMVDSLAPYFREINTFKKFPALFYKGEIFKKKEAYDFSKPHYHKERGRIASFIKLNIILIEFLFGYWLKIFPVKAKSHLVLYDRYFIDVLADPRRYRIKENKFFIKAFHYILPKPDIWIILDLPSDVLLQRKKELTYEMAEKLRYEYLNLHSFLPNSIVINNEEEIKNTVNKASTFILNYMHQRL